uniref:Galactosylceramide sulfotransferase-like n=1 Tax=Hirondellea gigas TaxID=1518452 RepID=A0A6A7FZL0_9CRUS
MQHWRHLSQLLLLLLAISAVLVMLVMQAQLQATSHYDGPGQLVADQSIDGSSCSPRQHIMFLKTHKCASSSLQNMFLRYGIHHHLSMAVPYDGNYIGSPQHFEVSFFPAQYMPEDGAIDIFAVHTRLNENEHRKIMHADASFVTVVREPGHLFESMYTFYYLKDSYDGHNLKAYLELPLQLEKLYRKNRPKIGYDMMLFDMGVNITVNMTTDVVRKAVQQMDRLFDIVLVAEEMDQSLILLKEHLCWDYSDIIFFNKNVRMKYYRPKISNETLAKIRELNSGDVMLYEHFLAKHKMAVQKYGINKMADDVEQLRRLRDAVFKNCGARVMLGGNNNVLFEEYSDIVETFALKNESNIDCVMLSMPELQLIAKVRSIIKHKLKKKKTLAI